VLMCSSYVCATQRYSQAVRTRPRRISIPGCLSASLAIYGMGTNVNAKIEVPTPPSPAKCGVIMPISPIDGCSAEHWSDVKTIISQSIASISEIPFSITLVSDADDIGVIQKRIVQNIYDCDVIVCDVSCKNANVMFELGMRLAFDKPTVIIKDDVTEYSFDTGIIEHISYPRDLRFGKIVSFKEILASKVLATYRNSQNDKDHSTFLKNFGTFEVASIKREKLSPDQAIMSAVSDLSDQINALRHIVLRRDRPVLTRSAAKRDGDMAEIARFIDREVRGAGDSQRKEHSMSSIFEYIEDTFDLRSIFSTREEARDWVQERVIQAVKEQRRDKLAEANNS